MINYHSCMEEVSSFPLCVFCVLSYSAIGTLYIFLLELFGRGFDTGCACGGPEFRSYLAFLSENRC